MRVYTFPLEDFLLTNIKFTMARPHQSEIPCPFVMKIFRKINNKFNFSQDGQAYIFKNANVQNDMICAYAFTYSSHKRYYTLKLFLNCHENKRTSFFFCGQKVVILI
jgi:hypothetical protein